MNTRRRIGVALGAGAFSLLIVTCGPSGMETIGDAMIDAGTALREAYTDDAHAEPRSFDGTCVEETRTLVVAYPDGRSTTQTVTYWTATVEVPGLDPATVQHALAVVCDYEDLTDTSAISPECPTGATCTGERFPVSAWLRERCNTFDAQVSSGRASIQCGNRQTVRNVAADGTETAYTTGSRWGSVRFVIEP